MSAKSNNLKVCCFCGLTEDDEFKFGKLYEHDGIITHYYCLLLSAKIEQNGNDDEGILGFLANDIKKELRRGKRLVCSYCRKSGATLGCCNTKCKRMFHYPCGLSAGALNQFFGEFRSYCINHRPKQNIGGYTERINKEHGDSFCYICYDDINLQDLIGTLWAPCCKKDAWFHRKCVQQLAMNAGYFFKCPLCNNNKEFQTEMLEHGIFIPSQDASWELEANAFQELLYRHNRCDAATCLCPKGRNHTSMNAKWELALCRTCGSQGIHMACGQLKWANPIWNCHECISILGKVKKPENSASETINITHHDKDTDTSDSEISVGGTQDKDDLPMPSYSYVRPGPRSFKLRQALEKKTTSITCEDNFASSNENIFLTSISGVSSSLNLQSNKSTDTVNICSSSKDKNVSQTNLEKRQNSQQPISSVATIKPEVIVIDSDDEVKIISSRILKRNLASCDKETKINNSNESVDISCKASNSLRMHKQTTVTDKMPNNINSRLSTEKKNRKSDNIEVIQQSNATIAGDTKKTMFSRNKDHKSLDMSPVMNIKITNVTSLSLDDFTRAHDLKNRENDAISQSSNPLMNLGNSKDSKIKSTRSQSFETQCKESELSVKRKYESNICVIGTHMNGIKTVIVNQYKKIKGNDSEENIEDPCGAITYDLQNGDQINRQLSQNEIKNGNIHVDQQIESINSLKTKTSNKNSTMHIFPSMLEVTSNNIPQGKINSNQSLISDQSTSEDVPDVLYNNTFKSLSIRENCTNVMQSQNLDDMERKSGKQSICDGNANTTSAGESTNSHAAAGGDWIKLDGVSAAAKWTNLLQGSTRRANVSDGNYISISSSSKSKTYSAFAEIESNPNACDKLRLIPKSVPLQDLKFKFRDSNNLQMILYDTFSVNIKMNTTTKNHMKYPCTSTEVCNMESSSLHLDDKSTVANCSHIQHSHDSHLSSNKNKRTAGTAVSKNVKNRADVKENFNPVTKTSLANISNNFSIVNVFDDKCQLMTR